MTRQTIITHDKNQNVEWIYIYDLDTGIEYVFTAKGPYHNFETQINRPGDEEAAGLTYMDNCAIEFAIQMTHHLDEESAKQLHDLIDYAINKQERIV